MSDYIKHLETALLVCSVYGNDHDHICDCRPVDVRKALAEIERLRSRVLDLADTMQEMLRQLKDAHGSEAGFIRLVEGSGLNFTMCSSCGDLIIAIPEGGVLCVICANEMEVSDE